MGKAYKSLGFAAVPWLAHLEMGLVRVLGEPEEITLEYLKCCFVVVLIDLARAICWLISQGFDPIATIDEQMERGERLWHNS